MNFRQLAKYPNIQLLNFDIASTNNAIMLYCLYL